MTETNGDLKNCNREATENATDTRQGNETRQTRHKPGTRKVMKSLMFAKFAGFAGFSSLAAKTWFGITFSIILDFSIFSGKKGKKIERIP
jgi:hypothetical protein